MPPASWSSIWPSRRIAVFGGGYDAYLDEREIARQHARDAYEQFASTKADLVGRARTQREWSSQGVRNAMKKSPDNDKIRRRASTESSEKQAQKVRQMESRIARLDEVDEPRKEWQLEFTIGSAPRSSAVVATLADATFTPGRRSRSGPCRCRSSGGDRIGITGPNGAGKSTLLRALLGRQRPDDRHARLSARASPSARSTRPAAPSPAESPWPPPSRSWCPLSTPAEVRTLLAKFGLKADHVSRPVDELSPGERTRAALALLQARGVNVLVLDEPTNHLDLAAIEQLEQALDAYDGTLLLVTHDRRMLDAVRVDRRWDVEAGRVREL